jgi:hypothetical protein
VLLPCSPSTRRCLVLTQNPQTFSVTRGASKNITRLYMLCQTLSLLCHFNKSRSLNSFQMQSWPADFSHFPCKFLDRGPFASNRYAPSRKSSPRTTKLWFLAKATTATGMMSDTRASNSSKLLQAPIKPLGFSLLDIANAHTACLITICRSLEHDQRLEQVPRIKHTSRWCLAFAVTSAPTLAD